jgi:tripartite-type tricarboxylate transporter receptor subunit TctC
MRHHRLLSAIALCAAAGAAQAQAFPDRPIQMLVPFGPGGTTDIMARLLQDEMAKVLGGSIVVNNVAGAGGAIAMAQLARARADGYTIAMTAVGPLAVQSARKGTTYTPDSFDYICQTYDAPVVTFVPMDAPHGDIKAFAAAGKAAPGKFNYGSSGVGSVPHLAMLALFKELGVEATHVPYKSTGDMVLPLKSGQIVAFNDTPAVGTQHQLKGLVTLADEPAAGFEKVPTAKALGMATRASVWGGVVAPKGLPADVRSKLESACEKAVNSPAYKARAQAQNNPLAWRDGAAFRSFVLAEHERYGRTLRENQLDDK